MRNNWSKYVLKIFWVAGLIALIQVSMHFEGILKFNISTTFDPKYFAWYMATAPVFIGMYISLICKRKWSFKINVSMLLCITLPCFLIAFYSPVGMTIAIFTNNSISIPFPNWMIYISTSPIPSIVAGLTLILGLFGNKETDAN
ncbi:hypothetical protein [Psychrobacillus sp.]|uniref:hypothetical protein n=1 Tax=Psychrobacillus sp. TaxID=1871623 RepID=UPI0028BF35D4|nr:hypothetical protein [Psychrobacillus sp.]